MMCNDLYGYVLQSIISPFFVDLYVESLISAVKADIELMVSINKASLNFRKVKKKAKVKIRNRPRCKHARAQKLLPANF